MTFNPQEVRRANEEEPTSPLGMATNHWLLMKLQRGEITPEEYVKLAKQRGKDLAEAPLDTSKK